LNGAAVVKSVGLTGPMGLMRSMGPIVFTAF
jgi:hypothetical protein